MAHLVSDIQLEWLISDVSDDYLIVPSYEVAPDDLTHSHTLTQPVVVPVYSPDDMAHEHTMTSPTIVHHLTVSPDDLTHTHSLSEPTITTPIDWLNVLFATRQAGVAFAASDLPFNMSFATRKPSVAIVLRDTEEE